MKNLIFLSVQNRFPKWVILACLLLTVFLAACDQSASNNQDSTDLVNIDPAVIEKQNDAIRQIVAEMDSILQSLQNLNQTEKNSVAALLTIAKVVGSYESTELYRDEKILNSYYKRLSNFSENFSQIHDVKVFISSCFDKSVSCLGIAR